MRMRILSGLKNILLVISPYVKYVLFLWIALYPSRDLYFELFDAYMNKYMFLIAYFTVTILISCCANRNRELRKISWGQAVYDYLSVELFFFALFAQKHAIVSIIIIAATIVFYIWFHRYIGMNFKQARRRHHDRASAVVCLILCCVLILPSLVGINDEYFSSSITYEEWEEFVSSFKMDYGSTDKVELFDKYDSVVREMSVWDEFSTDERVELLNKVVLIEKENLGIDSAEFIVTTDKLDEYTCGFYSDSEREICLSISQISGGTLEENIGTVCHEVFHAYEHYVVENIDFSSTIVQENYYFANAREWKDNIKNYVQGTIDYDMYISQPLEAYARNYSDERVTAYMDKLNK